MRKILTVAMLSDSSLMRQIRSSAREIRRGHRRYSFEEVFSGLGARRHRLWLTFLVVSLCFPYPAFALKTTETAQGAGLEELTHALDPDGTFRQLVQLVTSAPVPSPTQPIPGSASAFSAAGLEESGWPALHPKELETVLTLFIESMNDFLDKKAREALERGRYRLLGENAIFVDRGPINLEPLIQNFQRALSRGVYSDQLTEISPQKIDYVLKNFRYMLTGGKAFRLNRNLMGSVKSLSLHIRILFLEVAVQGILKALDEGRIQPSTSPEQVVNEVISTFVPVPEPPVGGRPVVPYEMLTVKEQGETISRILKVLRGSVSPTGLEEDQESEFGGLYPENEEVARLLSRILLIALQEEAYQVKLSFEERLGEAAVIVSDFFVQTGTLREERRVESPRDFYDSLVLRLKVMANLELIQGIYHSALTGRILFHVRDKPVDIELTVTGHGEDPESAVIRFSFPEGKPTKKEPLVWRGEIGEILKRIESFLKRYMEETGRNLSIAVVGPQKDHKGFTLLREALISEGSEGRPSELLVEVGVDQAVVREWTVTVAGPYNLPGFPAFLPQRDQSPQRPHFIFYFDPAPSAGLEEEQRYWQHLLQIAPGIRGTSDPQIYRTDDGLLTLEIRKGNGFFVYSSYQWPTRQSLYDPYVVRDSISRGMLGGTSRELVIRYPGDYVLAYVHPTLSGRRDPLVKALRYGRNGSGIRELVLGVQERMGDIESQPYSLRVLKDRESEEPVVFRLQFMTDDKLKEEWAQGVADSLGNEFVLSDEERAALSLYLAGTLSSELASMFFQDQQKASELFRRGRQFMQAIGPLAAEPSSALRTGLEEPFMAALGTLRDQYLRLERANRIQGRLLRVNRSKVNPRRIKQIERRLLEVGVASADPRSELETNMKALETIAQNDPVLYQEIMSSGDLVAEGIYQFYQMGDNPGSLDETMDILGQVQGIIRQVVKFLDVELSIPPDAERIERRVFFILRRWATVAGETPADQVPAIVMGPSLWGRYTDELLVLDRFLDRPESLGIRSSLFHNRIYLLTGSRMLYAPLPQLFFTDDEALQVLGDRPIVYMTISDDDRAFESNDRVTRLTLLDDPSTGIRSALGLFFGHLRDYSVGRKYPMAEEDVKDAEWLARALRRLAAHSSGPGPFTGPSTFLRTGLEEGVQVRPVDETLARDAPGLFARAQRAGRDRVVLLPVKVVEKVPVSSRGFFLYSHMSVVVDVLELLPKEWDLKRSRILYSNDPQGASLMLQQAAQVHARGHTVIVALDSTALRGLQIPDHHPVVLLVNPDTSSRVDRKVLAAFLIQPNVLKGLILDLTEGSIWRGSIQGVEYFAIPIVDRSA